MRLLLYEDSAAGNLAPIAHTRPIFELVCGRFSLRERLIRLLNVSDWGVLIRSVLEETYREEHPEACVNNPSGLLQTPTLFVNGRWLPPPDFPGNLRDDEVGLLGERVVYLTVDPLEAPLLSSDNWNESIWNESIAQIARLRRPVEAGGRIVEHPWDLVEYNPQQLRDDFHNHQSTSSKDDLGDHVVVLGPRENVCVDAAATIDPFVVLDARQGPISIVAGAVIGSFTQIEGPAHIGCRAQLFRAHIRAGTTIGPECRAGGEIEASILHAYVNKYHTGFLGHSYVCPWVNLGALSTNSDLKNDYSTVRVPRDDELVETGMVKVGCFIGDHTKTALGCLFNTGSSIGVMCMVLPGGELLPKHIPSFSRIWHGRLTESPDLDRDLETARIVMNRRNHELTSAQERLLRTLAAQTRPEREDAILRYAEKAEARVRG